MRLPSVLLVLLSLVVTSNVSAQSVSIKPYTARYAVHYKGISGGEIEFALKREDGSHYVFSSHLLPNFLGSVFTSDQAEDISHVTFDGSSVKPLRFRSEDGSKDSAKDIRYDFDWSKQEVSGLYKNMDFKLALPKGAQDRLSVQLAAMLSLQAGQEPGKLLMLERNEFREYSILRKGNEKIKVAAGEFDTLILVSERVGSNRTTRYWYAPKLGYIPVRAERSTKDKPDILMELKSIQMGQ